MKTFELTCADGSKTQIKAPSWRELVITDSVVKIEAIDFKRVREAVRGVNNQFHRFGKFYHSLNEIGNFVVVTLRDADFQTESLKEFTGDIGEMRCIPIGKGIFLCVTWYKMGSGAYEFVGYVS